jgi:flotillin
VAAELARPMAGIDKLTVISADGAGELPKQVTTNFVQTMELLKTTTGLDVEQLIQKYARTDGAHAQLDRAAAASADGQPVT